MAFLLVVLTYLKYIQNERESLDLVFSGYFYFDGRG